MNRLKIIAAVAALALPLQAFAESSSVILNTTNGQVFAVEYGSGPATVRVDGVVSATSFSPALNSAANGTFGGVDVQTNLDFTVASITVTNGQIIVLTSTYTELLNTGTDSTTTTNTFAALSAAQVGRLFVIQAAAANTDSIAFAETGILVSGGTLTLGASDGFTAIARATNILRQTTAVMNN